MVTGLGCQTAAIITNPMTARRRKRSPSRRRRQQQSDQLLPVKKLLLLVSVSAAIIIFALFYLMHSYNTQENGIVSIRRQEWEEGLPHRDRHHRTKKHVINHQPQQDNKIIHTSSIDTIIKQLNKLAKMPPTLLWKDVFGMEKMDYGDDPFSLRELENGKCPWEQTTVIDWLPPRPYNSEVLAKTYQRMMQQARKKRGEPKEEQYDADNEVVVWYEHLSKAGGTTFCGLAQSNMLRWQVPKYHCMPRRDDRPDGRVGTWTNEYLLEHVSTQRHSIVSNEWDPFNIEKLQLSGRQLDGMPVTKNREGPNLLFLTTLRDPCDRLLSAYTFFALTTTEARREKNNREAPSFHEWVENNMERAGKYEIGSRTAFRSNTARLNHIVWRFSGGSLTNLLPLKEDDWKDPFETAIRTLSQHDLILPMDVMTQDDLGKTALQQLLGWDNFEVKGRGHHGDKKGGHVVTTGGIKNSNAREHFSSDEFQKLWEGNWLDNILYLWCRAVFLARLHCKDSLAD